MKKQVKVFIITFKQIKPMESKIYIPLMVGKNDSGVLNYLCDSTGDNISFKNKNYCELTGLYWIWKNINADIVGLVHYRRFFYKNIWSNTEANLLEENDILNILQKYDCIITKKVKVPFGNVEKNYSKHHYQQDYDIVRQVIQEMYPEYSDSFEKTSKSNYFYNLNMMICKKSVLNDYSKWLFNILFETEKRANISSYSDYQKRIYGFLSEVLLRVWLDKNNIKIKECYVYNNEINFFKQFIKKIVTYCIIKR